jgi:hypothetical protein
LSPVFIERDLQFYHLFGFGAEPPCFIFSVHKLFFTTVRLRSSPHRKANGVEGGLGGCLQEGPKSPPPGVSHRAMNEDEQPFVKKGA